jgi:hypothetical protein
MSFEFFVTLMGKHRHKGLLVDTNVLLLLLIGSLDSKLIGNFKITANQGFDEADFNLLRAFVGKFQKIVTTPHILTEVSNHADKIKGDAHKKIFGRFVSLIEQLDEHTETTKALVKSDAFVRFGLTDTAISSLASKNFLVLTVDFPLVSYLQSKKADVINFNHLRQMTLTD